MHRQSSNKIEDLLAVLKKGSEEHHNGDCINICTRLVDKNKCNLFYELQCNAGIFK
jgi:hypothetical protein